MSGSKALIAVLWRALALSCHVSTVTSCGVPSRAPGFRRHAREQDWVSVSVGFPTVFQQTLSSPLPSSVMPLLGARLGAGLFFCCCRYCGFKIAFYVCVAGVEMLSVTSRVLDKRIGVCWFFCVSCESSKTSPSASCQLCSKSPRGQQHR